MNEEIVTADAVNPSTIEDSAIIESEESAEHETEDSAPASPELNEQDKIEKRIAKATYEKHQALRAADEARKEAAELRQKFESGAPLEQGDIAELVKAEAVKLKAEESFNDACNKTYDAGVKEHGQAFDKAMQNLSLIGMTRDFLEMVSATDAGPKILYHLGQDLDEAERIANLSPVKMARELTLLEVKLGREKVKKVSKAPEPLNHVTGRSGGSKSPAEMTDAEYAKWRRGKTI